MNIWDWRLNHVAMRLARAGATYGSIPHYSQWCDLGFYEAPPGWLLHH